MDGIIAILHDFGFSQRTARRIAKRARENNLTIFDVKAWISEATNSQTILNPLGFVRSRIQDGDKLNDQPLANCHQSITQTCTCGRICAPIHFCEYCDLCPSCCECIDEQGEP